MIEKLLRNPLALAGAFVASALLGAALFAALLALVPSLAGPAVRGYLLEHPEVLPEAMDKLRAREAERLDKAQESAQADVARHLPQVTKAYGSAWAGNPNGDVTLVAFMDYACGYCRASLPGIQELLAKDPNVRVVYREYPVLGPESVMAARWALAAAEQGKYTAFHEALYAGGAPSEEAIAEAAAKAGLDKARAEAAIRSKPVEQEILENHRLGGELAMTGTPSWVIGGKLFYGARDYDGLAAAVAEARKTR
jgi:protein-disulfide isomerase